MRNLAPDIVRQRLLIEGYYRINVDPDVIRGYLSGVSRYLGLRTYGDPIIHCPAGEGSEANQGYDAFVPLIDSGISLYVWSARRFYAVVLFTCKAFDETRALEFTRTYFHSDAMESAPF